MEPDCDGGGWDREKRNPVNDTAAAAVTRGRSSCQSERWDGACSGVEGKGREGGVASASSFVVVAGWSSQSRRLLWSKESGVGVSSGREGSSSRGLRARPCRRGVWGLMHHHPVKAASEVECTGRWLCWHKQRVQVAAAAVAAAATPTVHSVCGSVCLCVWVTDWTTKLSNCPTPTCLAARHGLREEGGGRSRRRRAAAGRLGSLP